MSILVAASFDRARKILAMLRVNLGEDLSADTLAAIARGEEVKLVFGRDAVARVKKARATVDAIVKRGAPVYGVNT
ncbi:MAG: aromatic amino acid lyase, partial [Planctomycetota bacterium]